jgi:sulfide dehydrogenase cytochrome subunit
MRYITQQALALVFLMALLPAGAAPTQSQPPSQPKQWLAQTQAATCTNCHASKPTDSNTGQLNPAISAIPPLYSLSAQYIQEAMLAFKYNQRPATVMHQLAKGYSDTDIARISQVLGQPTNQAPVEFTPAKPTPPQ